MNQSKPSEGAPAKAREALAQLETGDPDGVAGVEDARAASPADVDAVEQEASEGPAGRGLAR